MDQHSLKKMLEKSADAAGDNPQFSAEEQKRFSSAFEDPEFRNMFTQYLDEIQDPAARQENELYISQLEKEDKVPMGKELIRPSPAFTLKTFKLLDNGVKEKLFINVVQSEKILKPTSSSSKEGTHWSVPYSLGPPHMEKDKAGCNAAVFDCCFNPEALRISEKYKQFHELLWGTAIDAVEASYEKQNIKLKLDREGTRVVKGMAYMRGQVPTMLIDRGLSAEQWQTDVKPSALGAVVSDVQATTPFPSITAVTESAVISNTPVTEMRKKDAPALKKGFLLGKSKTETKEEKKLALPSTLQKPTGVNRPLIEEIIPTSDIHIKSGVSEEKQVSSIGKEDDAGDLREVSRKIVKNEGLTSDGPTVPRYTLTERGRAGLGDFDGVGGRTTQRDAPTELIYRVQLPAVFEKANKRLQDVVLEVAEKSLSLKYLDIYALELKLPYEVLDKKGTAKFDKISKSLTITLPVKPPVRQDQRSDESNAGLVEVLSPETEEEAESVVKDELAGQGNAVRASVDTHKRWVSEPEPGNQEGRGLREEIASLAQIALETASKEPLTSVPKAQPIIENLVDDAFENDIDFVGRSSFSGYRRGFVFKTGPEGLGYYREIISKKSNLETSHTPPTMSSSMAMPSYNFRETEKTVAILIQVSNILADSVKIQFRTVRHVFVSFTAEEGKRYGLEIQSRGDVDENKSTYDAALKNMVLVLSKSGVWSQEEADAVTCTPLPSITESIILSSTINPREDMKAGIRSSDKVNVNTVISFAAASAVFELD